MSEPNPSFPELLAAHQHRLLSYVVSLLGDAESAWNVLQETNRVLLEKRDEFRDEFQQRPALNEYREMLLGRDLPGPETYPTRRTNDAERAGN